MTTETFKTIQDYPNYSISNKGNVMNNKKGKLMKLTINSKGKSIVNLRVNGVAKTTQVSKIVESHFAEEIKQSLLPSFITVPFSDKYLKQTLRLGVEDAEARSMRYELDLAFEVNNARSFATHNIPYSKEKIETFMNVYYRYFKKDLRGEDYKTYFVNLVEKLYNFKHTIKPSNIEALAVWNKESLKIEEIIKALNLHTIGCYLSETMFITEYYVNKPFQESKVKNEVELVDWIN